MDIESAEIAALIALHDGLEHLGPADASVSRAILAELPPLPVAPHIVDLGCGTGASALLLADWFGTSIKAVDLSAEFLRTLEALAASRGLVDRIETIQADMGALDWPEASVDLLWSEGAAYNLTFTGALQAWRPLLTPGGLAVISELSWFTDSPPEAARAFWDPRYPTLATEGDNCAQARAAGFDVLSTRRLSAEAWWRSYYDPLLARVASLKPTADPVMASALAETELETSIFRAHSDHYGYTFYVLRAI